MFGLFEKKYLCTRCHYQGRAEDITPGNLGVEIFAWLLMVLPGIIYTLWRKANAYKGCPKCQSKEIVPLDSPAAKKMLAA